MHALELRSQIFGELTAVPFSACNNYHQRVDNHVLRASFSIKLFPTHRPSICFIQTEKKMSAGAPLQSVSRSVLDGQS